MNAILLISSADQKGITAAVTNFVFEHKGNILHADQHIDDQENIFFMRIEWSLEGFNLKRDQIATSFKSIADKFSMDWQLSFTDEVDRMAVFVSKHVHCLYDLLYRYKDGQLRCEIPLIISNHAEAKPIADHFGIRYEEFAIAPENKKEQEAKELALLKEENINCLALARYHQIFSGDFVSNFPNRIINIHHSFLPAFVGQDPYAQAYKYGVKIIGATSHYVIEELDAGPIIEQATTRVSHRDTLKDLKHHGEDLEKNVFARAIRLHLERKILTFNNKTVIFD